MAVCENHVEYVRKIDNLVTSLAELNMKVDSNHRDIEHQLDNKFELLTQSLLNNNKELCKSIIDLTKRADSNKVGLDANRVAGIKSRNITINGVVASIAGIVAALLTKILG